MVWIIFDLKNRSLAAAKALCQKKKNNNSLSKSSDAIWRCYYTQYIYDQKKKGMMMIIIIIIIIIKEKKKEEKVFFFGWYVRRPRDGETKFSPISFLFFVFYFYDSWRVPLFWIVFLLLLVYSFFFLDFVPWQKSVRRDWNHSIDWHDGGCSREKKLRLLFLFKTKSLFFSFFFFSFYRCIATQYIKNQRKCSVAL